MGLSDYSGAPLHYITSSPSGRSCKHYEKGKCAVQDGHCVGRNCCDYFEEKPFVKTSGRTKFKKGCTYVSYPK